MPSGPPKKRTKTSLACDACRVQKKKCSGNRPCEYCDRMQRPCSYPKDEKRYEIPARGSGRRARMKPIKAPTASAQRALPSIESLPTIIEGESRPDESSLGALNSIEASRPGSMEPTNDDPAGNAVGSISAYSWVQRAFIRLNKAGRIPADKATVDDAIRTRITEHGDRNPDFESHPVPLTELVGVGHQWLQKLTDNFFERACATYRYLHRPTVNSWVHALSCNNAGALSPVQLAIVCSVLAHGRLYLRQAEAFQMGYAEAAVLDSESLLASAKSHLDQERGAPRLESIQARLVHVHILLSSGRPNQAWYTFGMVVQLTLAMGLHLRRLRRQDPSVLYREMSCRMFWSVYATDKYLSIVLGRPALLDDDAITERYPSNASDEWLAEASNQQTADDDHDSEIEATVLQAKLCQVINRVIKTGYEMKTALLVSAAAANNARVEDWKRLVPPHLSGAVRPSSLIPVFQRQAVVLKLFHLHAIMLSNRPLLLQSFTEPGDKLAPDERSAAVQKGVDACVSSALDVVNSIIQFATEGQTLTVFWFTQNVTFSAICILYLSILRAVASKTTELSADEAHLLSQAHQAHQCLANASQGNSPGLRYSVVLDELSKEVNRRLHPPTNGTIDVDPGVHIPNVADCLGNPQGAMDPGPWTVASASGSAGFSDFDFDDFHIEDTSLSWPEFDAALLNNVFIGNPHAGETM